jgi:predicted enzyme related to lactoylglutathione lyase
MTIHFLRSRTTLGVRDVGGSVDFYTRVLGFAVAASMGEPPTFALLGRDDTGLGLVEQAEPAVAAFACCYFDVTGVEDLHRRCVDAGVTVTAPPTRRPWGAYDFVIVDPDGHQLAFGEVAPPGG